MTEQFTGYYHDTPVHSTVFTPHKMHIVADTDRTIQTWGRILAEQGRKQVNMAVRGQRSQNVSDAYAVSTCNSFTHTTFIHPRRRLT
jgi:hypothetical protein